MTTFNSRESRNRDDQDNCERHCWGELEYVDGAGSVIKVRGTGTTDEEMPVMNMGYSFNLPADSNAEVLVFGMNSDTNEKYALPQIPHDQQRQWAEGTGGIQHPTNPERAIEFNDDETWLKDGTFVLGDNKEITITIAGGNITMQVNGPLDIQSPTLTHNGVNVGADHVHTAVAVGAGLSGPPQP